MLARLVGVADGEDDELGCEHEHVRLPIAAPEAPQRGRRAAGLEGHGDAGHAPDGPQSPAAAGRGRRVDAEARTPRRLPVAALLRWRIDAPGPRAHSFGLFLRRAR